MKWNKVKKMAPLYVIGALDEKTAQDLEASLHSATPQKQRVIARWRDLATLLPQALPLQTPPDYLRERLLNRITEETRQTPIEIAVEVSTEETRQTPIEIAVEVSTSKEMAERAEKKVLPSVQPRRAELRPARWLLVAAAALLAFTAGYLFKQNSDLARSEERRVGKEYRSLVVVDTLNLK